MVNEAGDDLLPLTEATFDFESVTVHADNLLRRKCQVCADEYGVDLAVANQYKPQFTVQLIANVI